jgi:hypothetical protein
MFADPPRVEIQPDARKALALFFNPRLPNAPHPITAVNSNGLFNFLIITYYRKNRKLSKAGQNRLDQSYCLTTKPYNFELTGIIIKLN